MTLFFHSLADTYAGNLILIFCFFKIPCYYYLFHVFLLNYNTLLQFCHLFWGYFWFFTTFEKVIYQSFLTKGHFPNFFQNFSYPLILPFKLFSISLLSAFKLVCIYFRETINFKLQTIFDFWVGENILIIFRTIVAGSKLYHIPS